MHIEPIPLGDELTEERGAGNTVELRLVFPCTQANVRRALGSIMSGLGAMNLSEDDSSSVELVLAEVLNNVSEHAYRDEGTGMIELNLRQTDAGLSCRVIDNGQGMPSNTPPHGAMPNPNRPLEQQPEGGFGWFLIRHLTSDLTYMRHANSNVLSFRIAVGQAVTRN